jgi:hypothetical protein
MNSAYNSENEDKYFALNRCEVDMPCNSECSNEKFFIHSES